MDPISGARGDSNNQLPISELAPDDTLLRPLFDCVSAVLRLLDLGRLRLIVPSYAGNQWAGEILNAAEQIKEQWKPDPQSLADSIAARLRRLHPERVDDASMAETVECLTDLARDAFESEMIKRKIPEDIAEEAKHAINVGE